MINELILNYIVLFLLLELYEIQWQKANTLLGMLARIHQHYSKNIFLFFIMHPTFYFSIAFMILTHYNLYASSLFIVKTLDIVVKIILIKKVFIDKAISAELMQSLVAPLNKFMPYIGLLVYPPVIYLSLV